MVKLVTDEQIKSIVSECSSIAQVLVRLGLKPSGGNYQTIKTRLTTMGIDKSHFTGQLWSKGKTLGEKYPIQDYLLNKRGTTSNSLKLRLFKENIKQKICERCKLTEWFNEKIPLELHHIDGNHQNNFLDNLQILCPNCHSATPNHRGKNKKKESNKDRLSLRVLKKINLCKCGNKSHKRAKMCRECHNKNRLCKITWPSNEELAKLVWEKSTQELATQLGISDNSIAKRCKKYGISKPPRGYWAKLKACSH